MFCLEVRCWCAFHCYLCAKGSCIWIEIRNILQLFFVFNESNQPEGIRVFQLNLVRVIQATGYSKDLRLVGRQAVSHLHNILSTGEERLGIQKSRLC